MVGAPQTAHDNPYTGIRCDLTPGTFQFRLAHTFHTDVLQVRIRRDLMIPQKLLAPITPEELGRIRDGIARSIAEALRLAACKLLELPEMELSVTFRWKQVGVEVIFYDSVSGGAGYCRKLSRMLLSELIEAAANLLDCPACCTSSCSRCLRSYSNQSYWDEFRRIEAREWLVGVLALKQSGPLIQQGAKEISLKKIDEFCAAAENITIFRPVLADLEGSIPVDPDTENELPVAEVFQEWKNILKWLSDGKKVSLILGTRPSLKDRSRPKALRLASALLPHIQDGALRIFVGTFAEDESLPALEVAGPGAKVVRAYSLNYLGTVMDTPWPQSLLAVETDCGSTVHGMQFKEIGPDDLRQPDGVSHKLFQIGEKRDLATIFRLPEGAKVKRVRIVDRYAVAKDHNVCALKGLMASLVEIWKVVPEQIEFVYGPAGTPFDESDWRNRAFQVIRALQQSAQYEGAVFRNVPRSYREPRGDKHDRRVIVDYILPDVAIAGDEIQKSKSRVKKKGNAGSTERVLFVELTGGVSHLMDEESETNVFYWEILKQ